MHHINAEGKKRHVRHYLASLRAMAEEARAKRERIARLKSLSEGVSTAMGESVSGGTRRDLADIQHEVDELAAEYASDLVRYGDELMAGYRICPASDLPRFACWLHWYEGLTWYQVGRRLGYSEVHVRANICPVGVDGIYEAMPHHWRADAPEAI